MEPIPADEVEAYLPAGPPDARWLLRRFAGSLLTHYRTMDPLVAQFWAAPGVLPLSPVGEADEAELDSHPGEGPGA